jgi:flagellar hook-basal body complex protein FliE
MVAAGQLQGELEQCERTIGDLALPSGMGEFDTAAFTDNFAAQKIAMRTRIRALQTIKARTKARRLNYAIEMERQLQAQVQNQAFLEEVQNDVNNFFKARCDDVFNKLQKATQLALATDAENSALLLTQVRRAMKAASDHFYPPVWPAIRCRLSSAPKDAAVCSRAQAPCKTASWSRA